MRMCKKCHKWLKDNNGYLSGQDEIVPVADCGIHPCMANPRVARTLKTLVVWGLEPEGAQISVGAPGRGISRVVISLGDGWVHLRNAKLQLFDYEVPFIDLLIEEGMVEKRECRRGLFDTDPAAVRATMKGHVWIKELQIREEARKQTDAKIEEERAVS